MMKMIAAFEWLPKLAEWIGYAVLVSLIALGLLVIYALLFSIFCCDGEVKHLPPPPMPKGE